MKKTKTETKTEKANTPAELIASGELIVLAENAPVLAAAPEMYDVLKKAKKFLGDLSDDNVRSRMNEMCDLYGLIRAVVEKAGPDPDGGTKR